MSLQMIKGDNLQILVDIQPSNPVTPQKISECKQSYDHHTITYIMK